MAKQRVEFLCDDCGASTPRWAGRCPTCGEWNSLREGPVLPASTAPIPRLEAAVPIADVDMSAWSTFPTGIGELDRVLAGGLVPGSATLLGGEPGVGKSTLLTQAAGALAGAGHRVLYVSAEESSQQVRLRAERLGAVVPNVWLASETDLTHVI